MFNGEVTKLVEAVALLIRVLAAKKENRPPINHQQEESKKSESKGKELSPLIKRRRQLS